MPPTGERGSKRDAFVGPPPHPHPFPSLRIAQVPALAIAVGREEGVMHTPPLLRLSPESSLPRREKSGGKWKVKDCLGMSWCFSFALSLPYQLKWMFNRRSSAREVTNGRTVPSCSFPLQRGGLKFTDFVFEFKIYFY